MAVKLNDGIVGHAPREVSRYLFYFTQHDGSLSAIVSSTQRRKSPIMQGGIEIQIRITASISQEKEKIFDKLKSVVAIYTNGGKTVSAHECSSDGDCSSEGESESVVVVKKTRRVTVISDSDSD